MFKSGEVVVYSKHISNAKYKLMRAVFVEEVAPHSQSVAKHMRALGFSKCRGRSQGARANAPAPKAYRAKIVIQLDGVEQTVKVPVGTLQKLTTAFAAALDNEQLAAAKTEVPSYKQASQEFKAKKNKKGAAA